MNARPDSVIVFYRSLIKELGIAKAQPHSNKQSIKKMAAYLPPSLIVSFKIQFGNNQKIPHSSTDVHDL